MVCFCFGLRSQRLQPIKRRQPFIYLQASQNINSPAPFADEAYEVEFAVAKEGDRFLIKQDRARTHTTEETAFEE